MIYFVTSREEEYENLPFEENEITLVTDPIEFRRWMLNQLMVNLDTETNMVENGPMQHDKRLLYVLQFGSIDQEDQYIFDMVNLDIEWLDTIRGMFSSGITFIAHNAKFDYIVLLTNLGRAPEEIHDTYLMSKILNTGYKLPAGYHSLAGCVRRFTNIEISKEEQTSFTGAPLTLEQIQYAAIDVMFLYDVFESLRELLTQLKMWYLYDSVEREVMKVYSLMELSPMGFNRDYWETLSDDFIGEANQLQKQLNQAVLEDNGLVARLKRSNVLLGSNLIQSKDEYKMNWASIVFKRDALKLLAPSLPDDVKTKPAIKKFLKEDQTIPLEDRTNLNLYMNRDYTKLDSLLINNHHNFLEENGYFVKDGTLLINWASPVHKLYIFKYYYPKLENTNAKSLVKITKNKLINIYKKWAEAEKRVTTYGKGFLERYVRDDGTIAPANLNQILNTGRISFGILLQMPAESRFRNAFLPPRKGDVFIDTDYSSIEVLIASYLADEEHFLGAVKKGLDLHSMSASMMFKDKWKDIAEDDCEQIKSGKKCSCPQHKKFRDFSKTVTFGLFYGIGPVGLADRLGIERGEAQDLINKFFKAFPKFKKFFDKNEKFGMRNNFIKGVAPTNRIRFFHPPVEPGEISSIGRASKNFPIQEASASILKLALIKLREKAIVNKLDMRIHLPIHDEILSSCAEQDKDLLIEIQEEAMIEAAADFIDHKLVSVDTNVLDIWTK